MTRFLVCDSEEAKAHFPSHKVNRNQDLALGVSVEVDTVSLSRQRELVFISLSELKAKPLQTHPADLTVMTRRDDPLNEVVHLVPVISLGQCMSNDPFRSDVKQGEMLLFNEPLPLFQPNDNSLTPLIILDDQESIWESGW